MSGIHSRNAAGISRPRVAIVGSGISGLGAAHALYGHADLTLFEAGSCFGGHAHTVDVTLPGREGRITHGVDTGFQVFNERSSPGLVALLAELGVQTASSDMSFSATVPGAGPRGRSLQWAGSSLNRVFAQRANLARPAFLRMLRDILRFNRIATRLAVSGTGTEMLRPLGDFLAAQGFSSEFRDWYLLPMMACIWSCPTGQMLQFPVATMVRFCHHHGLLQVTGRPPWCTVAGGTRRYVERIVSRIGDKRLDTPVRQVLRDGAGVTLVTSRGAERFDKVILAAHADQSLSLLHAPTAAEQRVLGAIRYQSNRAVLHTDASVLPSRKLAWAAWNYERIPRCNGQAEQVCLHYLLNLFQPLPFQQPVMVSLNPVSGIADDRILGEFNHAHPVFDVAAIRAQRELPALQGRLNSYFCGAWTGHGFHEDGLQSGLGAAARLLQEAATEPLRQAA